MGRTSLWKRSYFCSALQPLTSEQGDMPAHGSVGWRRRGGAGKKRRSPFRLPCSTSLTPATTKGRACLRMVVGDSGKEVVQDVGVSDVVVEGVQEAVAAVAGGQGPPQPVPPLAGVVRQGGVGVLEQGDHDQPGVDHEVWHHVHLHRLQLGQGSREGLSELWAVQCSEPLVCMLSLAVSQWRKASLPEAAQCGAGRQSGQAEQQAACQCGCG